MQEIQVLTVEQVYELLRTRPTGLNPSEVRERSAAAMEKENVTGAVKTWFKKVAKQFTHFFALMLWAAAGLCFFVNRFQPGEGMLTLGWTIILVIFINGAFSFSQEFRAEKAAQALKNLLPQRAKVIRDGKKSDILVDDLVEGDVVILQEGDRVAADIRLVEANGFQVNNATLTGESDVLARVAVPSSTESVFEADNIAFSGTLVLSGRAVGVVFATGGRSQFGRVASLTTGVKKGISPLEHEIIRVSKTLTLIALALGSVFFFLGLLIGRSVFENLLFAIGILVAVVPEGLLPTVTLTLAVGSQRMAKRNALVKELNSIETLGCTTVICTDKTGTITENKMKVEQVWLPEESQSSRHRAYLVMGLSNTLSFPGAKGEGAGDPMELAFIRAAGEYLTRTGPVPRVQRLDEYGFTPERKRMTVICKVNGLDGNMAATKGAPETVLPLCELVPEVRERVEKAALVMAGKAMRVLALAFKEGDDRENKGVSFWESKMTFAGLVGLTDPIRPDVPEAVTICRTAGIRVMMITGDSAATARAVASRAGIIPDGVEPVVLTGKAITEMDGEQLRSQLRSITVIFARMQPEHKLRVVSELQEMGEVVAMTGDGVNDAPALRKSDIGIAMGLRGTDVARESSDMVLLDDHFATIVSAIEEGRAVFSNIRKFMTYFFASNVPEIVPFLAFVLFRIPLPLSVIQIMSIDLGTDMLPALALGMEKPRREVMERPPRSKDERLLTPGLLLRAYIFLGMIEATAGMSGYFYVLYSGGWRWGEMLLHNDVLYLQATTACLAAVILAQAANLFACRSQVDSTFRISLRSNPIILWGVAWIFTVLFLLVYTDPGRKMFRTWPLSADTWLFLLIFPPILLLLDEGRKWLVHRMKLKQDA